LIEMAIKMGQVMMPSSPRNALAVQSAFRALSLYKPARDYVMQMKYKPQPHFEQGLMTGDAAMNLRGRMFVQRMVEHANGSKCLFDCVLGKGFAVIEWDDGALPLAPRSANRLLGARVVRVIPRDHRFIANADDDVECVRDLTGTGTIGKLLDQAAARGVVLRPDRYVAACLARSSGAGEIDRVLESLVRLSASTERGDQQARALDLAIA
jgi:3-(3-hydroxy-phenyl)propionate hydroxylase